MEDRSSFFRSPARHVTNAFREKASRVGNDGARPMPMLTIGQTTDKMRVERN